MSSTIQNISVHGGTGGPGGPGGNAGTGGGGGQGEGPHVTMVSESGVVNHMTFHNASIAFKDEVKTKNRKMCLLPVPSFTGRQEILDEIHQYFVQDLGSRKVFVLHGLGGSGKSQLAFKFVQQAQTSKRFSETYFVDATSEQTAESDLKLLPPATSEETAQEGLHWLASQQTEWLLVLDNADDPKLDISKFFPPSTFGNILITTRNPELCTHGADYKVSDMTLDDAKNLLLKLAKKKAIGDDKEQVAITIVKELHCFALAVTQAGGYIHACSSLNKYLELYKSSRDNLLQRAEVQGQGQYGLAVYATWNLSYQKLSTGSRTFLHICSQLHHQNIREEMFQKAALSKWKLENSELQAIVNEMLTAIGGANQNWNSFIFLEIARELQSYSLIGQNIVDASYNVHPLIQYWSGTTLSRGDMSKIVFTMIGLSVSWRFELEDYTYRHSLIYHITQLFGRCKCDLDTYVADGIALVLYEAGHYEKVEVLQVAIVKRRKEELGNEHPDMLTSMESLAATYRELGRWSDAESLEVTVLAARKRMLGNEHPDTLRAMASLAATYRQQGRWGIAESLEGAVLEARKRVLGKEHPDTLMIMANLAVTHGQQGRWRDAESLEVAVLEARKRLLGNEHPETLRVMANLAATYHQLGRWGDAESLEVTVLEARKRVLGNEHPDTLTSMASLAATYHQQGRWRDAESLEVFVLEATKRVLGNEHLDTLRSMANLAATYRKLGRWGDAESLEVAVFEASKRVLGKEHPDTLTSMANLAVTYHQQGRWRDAESLEVSVLEATKRVLGNEHLDTLTSMANLAATYRQLGRWGDAESFEVAVLEARKRVLGNEHPDTLMIMANLAVTHGQQGRWSDAESLEVAVLEARKRVRGYEHPDTLSAMANLAATYRELGRWSDAESLEVAVLEASKQVLGNEHPHTLSAMANLAQTYWEQGRWSDAESLEATVVKARVVNEDHEHASLKSASISVADLQAHSSSPASDTVMPAYRHKQRAKFSISHLFKRLHKFGC
ncbi:hypothetical protein R3P38DRAFT_2604543 [Favolaschia claudopus]|uniref:NB-ARC domain-containing protein n=1 Tax=Favolaschia claudopus TaxID=2862362 RepID=A0AAW0DGU9_9AGAR